MIRNFRELYQYRVLLWSLTSRELRARYRGSTLGFLWTFLNPALLMIVYAIVFQVYLRQDLENYTLFMFVGLLPWIWFSTSVLGGASSLSDRRDLLNKVRFPPQVLPATVVLSNGVNFLLALPLVFVLGAFDRVWPTWHALIVLPLIALQAALTLGVTYFISAANVTFRDVQQIVSSLMTLAFFLTPILYPLSLIPERWRAVAVYANPMAGIVTAYQDILYQHRLPDPGPLLAAAGLSLVLLALSAAYFSRRREDLAELV